jgi:hypothetical protein
MSLLCTGLLLHLLPLHSWTDRATHLLAFLYLPSLAFGAFSSFYFSSLVSIASIYELL